MGGPQGRIGAGRKVKEARDLLEADLVMEFHEVAELFPMMERREFADLCSDIKANGLREDIWVYEGKIIDGRNRYRACEAVGVEPRFREWDGGGSLVSFVVSLNLNRRHLNESQRAIVAAEVKIASTRPQKEGVQICTPISQTDAAKIFNVSRRSVASATKVLEQAVPEVVEIVKAGNMSVHEAEKVAGYTKRRQKAMTKKGRKAMRKMLEKAKAEALQTTESGLVTCLHCSPVAKFDALTISAFCQRLQFRAEAYAKESGTTNFGPIFNGVVLEIEEVEVSSRIKPASEKILDAIDRGTIDGEAGLVERVDCMRITKLARDEFDAAVTYLLDYGKIEVVKMQGKQDGARGARKDILRRKIVERSELTVEPDPEFDPDFDQKEVYYDRWA